MHEGNRSTPGPEPAAPHAVLPSSRFELAPPRRFVLPALLLLLSEEPGHGYSLEKGLREFRFGQIDRPTVYRALAHLEADGLVESWSEARKAAQARRVYRITSLGERVLGVWMSVIKTERDYLGRVLRRYQATGTTDALLAEVAGGWAGALGSDWSPVSTTAPMARHATHVDADERLAAAEPTAHTNDSPERTGHEADGRLTQPPVTVTRRSAAGGRTGGQAPERTVDQGAGNGNGRGRSGATAGRDTGSGADNGPDSPGGGPPALSPQPGPGAGSGQSDRETLAGRPDPHPDPDVGPHRPGAPPDPDIGPRPAGRHPGDHLGPRPGDQRPGDDLGPRRGDQHPAGRGSGPAAAGSGPAAAGSGPAAAGPWPPGRLGAVVNGRAAGGTRALDRYRLVPDRSAVMIDVRSTVGPISFGSLGLVGFIRANIAGGTVAADPAPSARLEIAVDGLRSGNGLYDAELMRRVDARRFPLATVELNECVAVGSPNRWRLGGRLTFHGVTRPVEGTVDVAVAGNGHLVVSGEQVFDIRDFAVPSPTMLMLRIFPDVRVRLQVEAAPEER